MAKKENEGGKKGGKKGGTLEATTEAVELPVELSKKELKAERKAERKAEKKGAAMGDSSPPAPAAFHEALKGPSQAEKDAEAKKTWEFLALHTAAVNIQKIWRSYFLRIRIGESVSCHMLSNAICAPWCARLLRCTTHALVGIVPGKAFDPTKAADEAMEKEPLKKTERTKLFVFVIANLLCGVVTGAISIYLWIYKIVPNPGEQSNYIIFSLTSAISGASIFGVLAVRSADPPPTPKHAS